MFQVYKPQYASVKKPSMVQIRACRMISTNPLTVPMLIYCRLEPEKQTSGRFESKYIFCHVKAFENILWILSHSQRVKLMIAIKTPNTIQLARIPVTHRFRWILTPFNFPYFFSVCDRICWKIPTAFNTLGPKQNGHFCIRHFQIQSLLRKLTYTQIACLY